jgi:hypothetical protein
MIKEYIQRTLTVGNGEYDSEMYYPHSIEAFLNLYDFSPKPETKRLAKVMLDYYLATYGLKVVDGALAGAMKRGFLPGPKPGEMETVLWAWTADNSRPSNQDQWLATIQQTTSTYRPNRIIYNILTKNIALPFEAQMARPTYHADQKNAFQESFYCSQSYALGNVAMTLVDNPNQQMVWSLVCKGTDGALGFGGSQPARLNPGGHSPYTQTVHKEGTLMLISAPTGVTSANTPSAEEKSRLEHASAPLMNLSVPGQDATDEEIIRFLEAAPHMAASWFYLPKDVQVIEINQKIYLEANQTFIVVHPLSDQFQKLSFPEETINRIASGNSRARILQQYQILVIPGQVSGFVVDTGEKSEYKNLENFMQQVEKRTLIDKHDLPENLTATYTSLQGNKIEMQYHNTGLRAAGKINGRTIDYEKWANGGVYQSPYIVVKNGILRISNGKEGYAIDFRKDEPRFSQFTGPADK